MTKDTLREFLSWKVPMLYAIEAEWGKPARGTVDEVARENNKPFIRTQNGSFTCALCTHATLGPMRVWYSYSTPIQYAALSEGLLLVDIGRYSNTTSKHQTVARNAPEARATYTICTRLDISQPRTAQEIVAEHHGMYEKHLLAALKAKTYMVWQLRSARAAHNAAWVLAAKADVPYHSMRPLELAADIGEKQHAKLVGKILTNEAAANELNNWPTKYQESTK